MKKLLERKTKEIIWLIYYYCHNQIIEILWENACKVLLRGFSSNLKLNVLKCETEKSCK